jgi:alpha-L-fucosidase
LVRALPSAKERAWQDLELGMFVHFAPNTWQDVESDNLSTPLSAINPVELSTDQWAQTAVALGARYLVFVAKHQGGFCMWQTKTTEYSIRNTPWKGGKGDVLREVEASCRKYGLKLGVYVCPRDDRFGAGTGGVCKTPELQAKYDAMYREQLTEVFTRYGELVEIWFDGSTVTPVSDLLAKYQPGAMVFQGPQATIRWVGNEDGFAPYPCWNGIDGAEAKSGTATALDSDPNGSVWLPSEVDVSIRRPDWFWSTKNANKVLTLEQLLSIYYRSVGRGAQLLLNIPANREGLLAEPDVRSATKFGSEVKRRFGAPVASTSGKGESIELKFAKPTRIDTVVLQEEIALGERVRGYRLAARVGGSWREIGTGSAIGHKRIQPVESQVVDAVRLVVTEAAAAPVIRMFAVFDTGVAPPADWNAMSSLWSANLVGKWAAGSFSLDLTKAVHAATEYLLRFHPAAGAVTGLRDVVLQIGDASNPALVKRVPGRSDELLLDITGLDKTVRVSGRVDGAESGSVTLERR